MKNLHQNLIAGALLLLLFVYWVYSEYQYAARNSPTGIATVADFYARHGHAARARSIDKGGKEFIVLSPPPPSRWSLVLPSALSDYVFDAAGKRVDWHPDPGDDPSWYRKWPLAGSKGLTDIEVRSRFL